MPYYTKYHLREQQAYALLGPMCASLRDLERRAQHYVDRLAMEPAEQESLRAAHQALAAVRAEVERIRRGSVR